MIYFTASNLTLSYAHKVILNDISFSIVKGKKVALVANNGAGKSTLLKVIMGLIDVPRGDIERNQSIRTSYLSQNHHIDPTMKVLDVLFSLDHPHGILIKHYEELLLNIESESSSSRLQEEMEDILAKIESENARAYETQVKTIISKLQLQPFLEQPFGQLSGGEAKRVTLAKVLLDEPDFLILDEPTNHLDLEMIERLEGFLKKSTVTLLLVTHDRYFLERVCNEIMELEQGRIYNYSGNSGKPTSFANINPNTKEKLQKDTITDQGKTHLYEHFLLKKADREFQMMRDVHQMKQLYRSELEWMNKMPQGRGTKSTDREKKFYDLEKNYEKLKQTQFQNLQKLDIEVTPRALGGKILNMYKLQKSFGEKCVVKDFSYEFRQGERIGIIGKNGVGKSSFVKLLTGELDPDGGRVEKGLHSKIGHYEQTIPSYENDKRIIDIVRDTAEHITLSDDKKITATQLLERFLFSKLQQQQKFVSLSGGEKKRLHLLVTLIKQPNILILDEPTNDLDLSTMTILEDFLQHYPGCLIIISHDRYFMDKLVDHIFVFEGNGSIKDIWGNYSQAREKMRKHIPASSPSEAVENSMSPEGRGLG